MSIVQPDETDTDYELIEEGPSSKVSRTWAAVGSQEPQWVAVKSATVVRKFSKEPHDIAKELRLLSALSHPNIINILSDSEDPEWSVLHLWMPFIPLSLPDLLASPRFSPHPFPPSSTPSSDEDGETAAALKTQRFTAVARSIMYQTLLGLTYLHGAPHHIAHRDIKPHNILLTQEGCVKLIDFGIAYKENEDAEEKEGDVWPEARPKLYFEVSTCPYRAPELLFGTRDYGAPAIDLWSLGATFAEFFTPLRLSPSPSSPFFDEGGEGDYGPHHVGDHTDPPPPFIVSVPGNGNGNGIVGASNMRWERETLFNGTRGELGLAWSVFKIRGTPTARNWPAFEHLPDAKGVEFAVVPSVPLAPLLPNLPPTPTLAPANDEEATLDRVHFPREETMSPSPLDLISRFLVYPSENRLRAARALEHPWFTGAGVGGVLLPEGYVVEDGEGMGGRIRMEVEMEGRPLGYWVRDVLGCGEE